MNNTLPEEDWIISVKNIAIFSHGCGVLEWCDFESENFKDYFNKGVKPYDAWVEEMYRMEDE